MFITHFVLSCHRIRTYTQRIKIVFFHASYSELQADHFLPPTVWHPCQIHFYVSFEIPGTCLFREEWKRKFLLAQARLVFFFPMRGRRENWLSAVPLFCSVMQSSGFGTRAKLDGSLFLENLTFPENILFCGGWIYSLSVQCQA